MSRHAFFVAGERVVHVANPCGAGFQYQAQAHTLPPQVQVGPHQHDLAETVLVVSEGTLEVMVNGAVGLVAAGAFISIPPKTWFAYRSVGDDPVRLLCRTAPAAAARHACTVTIHIAAA
ncbi:cupin domain-containing protein [Devosia sp. A16]|uniref:cupin domain-containing protein n=1 Tax=Devosia sp. A16 TaxID=1736675 RepID=UPI0006D85113|nr:cupin domain-containing protein [Devosia sp. A16]